MQAFAYRSHEVLWTTEVDVSVSHSNSETDLCSIDWNITIAVSILGNNITHAHTYVIVVLCFSVAKHEHLSSLYTISLTGTQEQHACVEEGSDRSHFVFKY